MVRVQGKEPKRQAGEEWRCVRWLRSLTLGCSRPFAEWGSEAHARVSCKIQRASGTRGQDPSLHLVSKGERQTRGKRELLFSRFLFLLCLEKNEVPRADSGPVPLEQLEQPLSLVFLGRAPFSPILPPCSARRPDWGPMLVSVENCMPGVPSPPPTDRVPKAIQVSRGPTQSSTESCRHPRGSP